MTAQGEGGVPASLILFTMVTGFVFATAASCMPRWWMALAAISLLLTGFSAFSDVRRRGR